MNTFTPLTSADSEFPQEILSRRGELHSLEAPSLPQPHPSEADLFSRHDGIPGHIQEALYRARITLIGAGGLNSWAALGLLRSGARQVTIIDPDIVDRTNLTRQLYYANDLGKPKAVQLVDNLIQHAVAGGTITGIAMRFEDSLEAFPLPADLLVVGVDRNDCRHSAARLARRLGIPAIFSMLSRDGMRCHVFFQGSGKNDACLWCALPNLDPEHIMPCASAVISSCFQASAYVVFFAHRALMGWPKGVEQFNWRAADLLGTTPDQTGYVRQRPNCPVCKSQS